MYSLPLKLPPQSSVRHYSWRCKAPWLLCSVHTHLQCHYAQCRLSRHEKLYQVKARTASKSLRIVRGSPDLRLYYDFSTTITDCVPLLLRCHHDHCTIWLFYCIQLGFGDSIYPYLSPVLSEQSAVSCACVVWSSILRQNELPLFLRRLEQFLLWQEQHYL